MIEPIPQNGSTPMSETASDAIANELVLLVGAP